MAVSDKNTILLLSTGGTISAAPSDYGLKPVYEPEELIALVPEVHTYCRFICKSVGHLDSTNIHPDDWIRLANEIKQAHGDNTKGVVIIHGTDTMAYTAAMLSFMVRNPKIPIVLTGAQLPIGAKGSDGKTNLLNAVQFAVFGPPGVFVVFNGKVIKGVRASKTNTASYSAFESINALYVAEFLNYDYIGSAPVTVFIKKIDWPEPVLAQTKFDTLIDPAVATVKITPGFKPDWLEIFCDREKLHGLILEGFGMGNIPNRPPFNLLPVLDKIRQEGIPVVVLSTSPFGVVDVNVYEVGQKAAEAGIIPGGAMTKEAALTKLMWVLKHTETMEDVRKMMTCNLAGEL